MAVNQNIVSSTTTNSAGLVSNTTYTYAVANNVVTKTADYTVQPNDTGTAFNNSGATGAVNFTLPPPAVGLEFKFSCIAAQALTVTTPSGAFKGGGSLTGTVITIAGGTAGTRYSSVTVLCGDGVNYLISASQGVITSVA